MVPPFSACRWLLSLAWLVAATALHAGGNVIFLHPDGASLNHWNAARVCWAGPDGTLAWDKLPGLALYRSHMRDSLTATSHGGGTIHAYGVKVPANSYGMDGQKPLVALSGKPQSLMQEAKAAGLAVGIINSGNLDEPGTGVFLASVPSRKLGAEIVAQILASGADVILGGGERWLLPQNQAGRHGPGARTDGRNLIAEASQAGYTVVYNRQELAQLPANTRKLLGVFASGHTFHDQTEERLAAAKLPLYLPEAPTVAEMTAAALRVFQVIDRRYFLMIEEEGTDNFANVNNAAGSLEALRRSDEAIAIAHTHVTRNPQTLLVVAADSDASGLQLVGGPLSADQKLPEQFDGRDGSGSLPFLAAADIRGQRLPFAIKWIGPEDTYGAVLVRAAGKNADLVRGNFDNTDLYRLIYRTLFERELPSPIRR